MKKVARDLFRKCFPQDGTAIHPFPVLRLIWGDGSFSHTGHGHPPCPKQGLRDALAHHFDECVMGSEDRTSKTSPCCDAEVLFIDPYPAGRGRAFRCKECKGPWNRDLAAALNIGRLHRHKENNGGETPHWAIKKVREKAPQ
jgi:hypothetical protein